MIRMSSLPRRAPERISMGGSRSRPPAAVCFSGTRQLEKRDGLRRMLAPSRGKVNTTALEVVKLVTDRQTSMACQAKQHPTTTHADWRVPAWPECPPRRTPGMGPEGSSTVGIKVHSKNSKQSRGRARMAAPLIYPSDCTTYFIPCVCSRTAAGAQSTLLASPSDGCSLPYYCSATGSPAMQQQSDCQVYWLKLRI